MSDPGRQVKIISKKEVFKKFFFAIHEVIFRHTLFNGKLSGERTSLIFDRGDSVGILMHNVETDCIILVEQFRYPTYEKGTGWIVEIPAGTIEEGEIDHPLKTVRREIKEEIGYEVGAVKPVMQFYLSPGGTSERIHLYYAAITPKAKTSAGGGVVSEGEDIRILSVKVDEALRMIDEGKLIDAKTIIALQWLALHRANLKS